MINPRDIENLHKFALNYKNLISTIKIHESNVETVRNSGMQNINVMCPTTKDPVIVLTLTKEECINILNTRIARCKEKLQSMSLSALFRDVTRSGDDEE